MKPLVFQEILGTVQELTCTASNALTCVFFKRCFRKRQQTFSEHVKHQEFLSKIKDYFHMTGTLKFEGNRRYFLTNK